MRFSATQENLNFGVSLVGRISAKSGALPILNNILVQCKTEGVYLSATNLEVGVKCLIRAKVEEEGDFTVPAKLFSDYINLLSDRVDVDVKNQEVEISSGFSSAKIKGLPASEFPFLPKVENGKKITINKKVFLQAVAHVAFAAANNETRPELSGVLIKIHEGGDKLFFTATDSYRLAEYRVDSGQAPTESFSVIVPSKTLLEVSRILGVQEDIKEVQMEIGANQIAFTCGNTEIISRLIDGVYPDYEQIIPKEFKTKTLTSKDALIRSIKAASLFSRSGIYDIVLKVTPGQGLRVASANSQLGENLMTIEAEVEGEANEITFNFHYLLDALQVLESARVSIQMIDAGSPTLLSPDQGESSLQIIMPIKQ
ncbi:MAG: DNA polymerase III subunit beta [Patescibacteria group bacterium]